MAGAGFWDDQEQAQTVVNERKSLIGVVKPLDDALAASEDLAALIETADEDEAFAAEAPAEIERLEELLGALKLRALLNGTHDAAGALLTINARDGGTDANDWAEML
ncbi:MAG: PCRF domain-containing protein, partial [Planctomycetota bacterium]